MGRGLVAFVVLVLVGCATTSDGATRAARAIAPSGCATGLGPVALPLAVGLALAGAAAGRPTSPTGCGGIPGAPAITPAPLGPGAPTGVAPRAPRPTPELPLAAADRGRFRCVTAEGDEDVIVADTEETARQVCRDLTALRCECDAE